MEFRQLEAYIKVVELGSFSKAAKELHVSQPSISTYISNLERELGTQLLNRSTKTVSTTLAGERFFSKAQELLALRADSFEAMQDLSTDHSGEIRLVASSVPTSYILPRLLADFHTHYPKVSFIVDQADTTQAVAAIEENRADIGFAGSIIDSKDCKFEEFADEELIFIGSALSTQPAGASKPGIQKPSARATKIYTLDELLYQGNFISRELGSGTRIQYEKFFTQEGIDLKNIKSCATMGNTESVINSVASGLGISIVSEIAARSGIDFGKVVELRTAQRVPHRKIYTVTNKRIKRSHLVKLFLDHIQR